MHAKWLENLLIHNDAFCNSDAARMCEDKTGLDTHVVYELNNKSQTSTKSKVSAATRARLQHPDGPRQIQKKEMKKATVFHNLFSISNAPAM